MKKFFVMSCATFLLVSCATSTQHEEKVPVWEQPISYMDAVKLDLGTDRIRFEEIHGYAAVFADSKKRGRLDITDINRKPGTGLTEKRPVEQPCSRSINDLYVIRFKEIENINEHRRFLPVIYPPLHHYTAITFSGTLVKKHYNPTPQAHMPFVFDGQFKDVRITNVNISICFY